MTGITRHIDELGRIVVPAELRRSFHLGPGDALDFSVEDDTIVLRKAITACAFCNSTDALVDYHDRAVCRRCLADLCRDHLGGAAWAAYGDGRRSGDGEGGRHTARP